MRVGIFHPTDPAGHVPGGIDVFIRGILRWAPPDLEYVLLGATSDPVRRPLGQMQWIETGGRPLQLLPVVEADASAARGRLPLTVRYLAGLRRAHRSGLLQNIDAMDFHRIETALAFHRDVRPRNLFLHQDMAVLRDPNCDIGWRRAPALYEFLEAQAFSRLQTIFAVRQSAVDRYRLRFESIADRFRFIPTWAEPDRYFAVSPAQRQGLRTALAAELSLPVDAPWIASVGRFDRQKDPLLMLEALRLRMLQGGQEHLVMVGDGTLRTEVESAIARLGLGRRVHLTGALPAARIAPILQAADLFALTSAYEGMPIVVLEALGAGLPVVTTDVGEVRRAVHHDRNGFVVRERTPAALAGAFEHVLRERTRLAGLPCSEAASEFTPERVLGTVYDNHRAQIATFRGSARR